MDDDKRSKLMSDDDEKGKGGSTGIRPKGDDRAERAPAPKPGHGKDDKEEAPKQGISSSIGSGVEKRGDKDEGEPKNPTPSTGIPAGIGVPTSFSVSAGDTTPDVPAPVPQQSEYLAEYTVVAGTA